MPPRIDETNRPTPHSHSHTHPHTHRAIIYHGGGHGGGTGPGRAGAHPGGHGRGECAALAGQGLQGRVPLLLRHVSPVRCGWVRVFAFDRSAGQSPYSRPGLCVAGVDGMGRERSTDRPDPRPTPNTPQTGPSPRPRACMSTCPPGAGPALRCWASIASARAPRSTPTCAIPRWGLGIGWGVILSTLCRCLPPNNY